MEFKQVIVAGEVFTIAKAAKPTAVVGYINNQPTVAGPGDFVILDRNYNLYVLAPKDAKRVFGHRLEVFK